MSRLAPAGGYQDDVALLLYRQPAPLQLDFPAETSQLAGTRTALRGWLKRAGMKPEQTLDVLIAAGEAIANSIEHGHRDRPGTVTLLAHALVDRVHVKVVDWGDWKVPQPDKDVSRGRGVLLMQALMHDVTIDSDAAGTTVNMYARID
jgi:anti-sigma regulatory factor (Ser/Thr protein kinase)